MHGRALILGCLMAAIAGCGSPPATTMPGDDAGADMGTAPMMDAFVPGRDAWTMPPNDAGPTCMGAPPPCESIGDATTCNSVRGCGYSQCAGTVADCHMLVTMMTCLAVPGCTWNGICGGQADPCSSHTDMASCTGTCTWGATAACSGSAVQCPALLASECLSQPGCGFEPPDAWVAPPDAWVAPPDANCMTGAGGSTMVPLHVITPNLAAPGTVALGDVHVHVESGCGGADMQLMTNASGDLTLDLPNGGAPWHVTLAKAGYAATSILDITNIGFTGDVRLDPLMIGGTTSMVAASGTITGPGAASAIFQVDCEDFDTIRTTAGSRTWSSTFGLGFERPEPPMQFVALELDGSGRAINLGSVPAMARPSTPVTGVSIPMPSPAATSVTTHIRIHLPTAGLTSPPSATALDVEHAHLDISNVPFIVTGTSVLTPVGGDPANLDLAVTHFPGPLDVNLTGIHVLGSVAVMNVIVSDIRDQDITVPPVEDLSSRGASLADVTVSGIGNGYDVVVLDIGESDTQAPRWRVIADARSGEGHIPTLPHLPAAVTLADIGLGGPTTTYIPLYVHMQTGTAFWTTQASNHAAWQFAYSVGTQYFTISTTGR